MNLIQQAKKFIEAYFTKNGIVFKQVEDPIHTFIQYHNFLLRVITAHPRSVLESREIQQTTLDEVHQGYYSFIKNRIEKGLTIHHWQSKKLLHADQKDWLFSGWGIQHLHISSPPTNGAIMAPRSDYLLFLLIRDDVSYHIAILPHAEANKWARKSFLEILYYNWPDIMEVHRLIGTYPTKEPEPDDEMREKLHKAGINTLVDIDGKVFASPNMGFNPNGYNLNSLIFGSDLHQKLMAIEKDIRLHPDFYSLQISNAGFKVPETLIFDVTNLSPNITIMETQTGFEFTSSK